MKKKLSQVPLNISMMDFTTFVVTTFAVNNLLHLSVLLHILEMFYYI